MSDDELSQDEVDELLATRKTQGVDDLHTFLNDQEDEVFRGTTDDIAVRMTAAFGRPYEGLDVRMLIAFVRSREHIEAKGWTIPYVGHGNQHPAYRVVYATDEGVGADPTWGGGGVDPTRQGVSVRSKDMLNLADRFLCQGEVLVAQTDGRTGVGKLARYFVGQTRAMRDNVALLADQLNHTGV